MEELNNEIMKKRFRILMGEIFPAIRVESSVKTRIIEGVPVKGKITTMISKSQSR